jgi:phytoene synthase
MSLSADYRACRTLLRAEDRDRYISVLFAPAAKRKHLFALYAFNAEIARVSEQVREPMMGELRLQWWRDAVDGHAAGDASRNPVAHALIDTIKGCNLPRAYFHELLDAHAFDFYSEPMESLSRLETYLDSTAVSLVRLALQILDGEKASEHLAATHAGRADALTGFLRRFAPHAARGRIFVPPLDVLARHGTNVEEAVSGEATPPLRAALREMRDLVRFHLAEARTVMAVLPKTALAAFFPIELVPVYLDQMESADYDPFRTRVEISPWKKPWLLWRAARKWKR